MEIPCPCLLNLGLLLFSYDTGDQSCAINALPLSYIPRWFLKNAFNCGKAHRIQNLPL